MKSLLLVIFWRDRLIRYTVLAALLLQASLWFLISYKIMPLANELDFFSLHYNIYFGIDLIGSWYRIFYIPVAGLLFLTINLVLIFFLYKKERFLSYLIAACSTLISLGLAVALLLITLLNI